jgi:putative endonuclease
MHFVYIIYSESADRYYVGETADWKHRLQSHRSGRQRWTSRASDWELKYLETLSSATEAKKRERQIKKSKSRKATERWIASPANEL